MPIGDAGSGGRSAARQDAGALDRLLAILTDPRAYLTFGVLLVLYNAIGVVFVHCWGGVDFWEHLASIDAIARSPLHPTNAYIVGLRTSHIFTPYHVAWGLVARLTSVSALTLAPIMAAVNISLFLIGVRALAVRLTGSAALAMPFALTLLFFWLRPWDWSGFYNFGLLPLTSVYPYWFALSLTLVFLGRLGDHEWSVRTLLLYTAVVALAFLTHPITGSFLALMLALRGVVEAGLSPKARVMRLAASAAGLALAVPWPYYSILAVIGSSPRFEELDFLVGWSHFYDKFPLRLLPAGLGLAYFARALMTRRWDWVGWAFATVAAIYLLNPVTARSVVLSRYVVYVALLLHVGILRGLSEALRLRIDATITGPRWVPRAARVFLATYLIVLLGAGALEVRSSMGWLGAPWSLAASSPAGDRGNRNIIRRFRAFAPFVGPSDVVMASVQESWVLPTILGCHVVAVVHGNPFLKDSGARQKAVARFFDPEVSADERRAILARYGVTRILVPRSEAPRLAGLGPLEPRIVHVDDFYELRTVAEAGKGGSGSAP